MKLNRRRSIVRHSTQPHLSGALALAAAAALVGSYGLSSPALAQVRRSAPAGSAAAAPPAAAAAAAAPAATAGETLGPGLDSLGDTAVISELADRGLTSLLNRMFDEKKIPANEREGFVALRALRELNQSKAVGNTKRILLVRQAVKGLNAVLPRIDKVEDLMSYTATLIERGIEPDVNTLEYWGANPVTEQQVKPAVEAAMKMLDKVGASADAEEKKIEAQMGARASDAMADRWQKMDGLKNTAKYVKNMVAYYLALATDGSTPAGMKERQAIAEKAINYLTGATPPPSSDPNVAAPEATADLDDPESGVMPLVHMRLGKLYWVKGDYAKARKYFQQVANKQVDEKHPIKPEPNVGEQFEARFFTVLTEISDKKPAEAEKGLADVNAWVKSNIPEKEQGSVEAALQLANFRVASLQAELAKDPAEKKKLDQKASDILTALSEKHPEFRAIITEQLVNRLPENVDFKAQSVPVLQALITKGVLEKNKSEKEPIDTKVMERAANAARELVTRKEGVTPKVLDEAQLLVAMFEDRMGHDVAAANAYLDYAQRYFSANKDMAGQALDRAVGIAYEQHKAKPDDTADKELYKRALSTAVDTRYGFNRKQLYYLYANWLRQTGQGELAAGYYRAVPKGDPNEFNARFYALLGLNNQLEDTKMTDAARKKILADMTQLIDEVRALGPKAKQTPFTKACLAATTQLGADLALREKNPQRALQLLSGFDQQVAGLSNAADMLREASRIKVNAYLATNQLDKAVAEVQALAKKDPAATAPFVRAVLERLDKDYDAASAANDQAAMGGISKSQAELTGYLVQWSSGSSDPKIKALAPQYRVYDANTKRRAGMQQADAAQKSKILNDALAAYLAVQSAGNLDASTDSTVKFGIGLTQYDLSNYKEASNALGTLIYTGKLGGPQLQKVDSKTGETRVVDNDAYWEAYYKWLRSNLQLAKDPANPDAAKIEAGAKQTLKDLFITNGARTGGEKFAADFDALRKEILPDWIPGTPASPPTSQPAAPPTQPVAAGVTK